MPPPPQETQIAEWQQPGVNAVSFGNFSGTSLIAGSLALSVLLAAFAFWQHDGTYYMASAVGLAAAAALFMQNRHHHTPPVVILTNLNLIIGDRAYPLAEIAGFWLQSDHDFTVINFEPKRASVLPVTVLYPEPRQNPVRTLILQVLPEVEPRQSTVNDRLNHLLGL